VPVPPPADPAPSGRGRLVAIIVGIGCVVAGLVLTAGVAFVASGEDYPDDWDPRVAEFVGVVEDVKGAPFEHPVPVTFQEDDEFLAGLSGEAPELTAEDEDRLAASSGMLRALGVAEGPIDLQQASEDIDAGGTLAYYDPVADEIFIRGTDLDLETEVTIVHELTHAWQDQHYDLDRWNELEAGEEADALLGLIEGDATNVQNAYVDDLSDVEQDEYYVDNAEAVAEAATDDVPTILIADTAWPYALGSPYLDLNAALDLVDEPTDGLFADPPSTTEQMLDIRAYLSDDDGGAVPDGWSDVADDDVVEQDSLGAMSWFQALADVLEPMDALAVADAWGGDEYVVHTVDGATCVDVVFVVEGGGSSALSIDEIDGLLETWTEALPDGTYEGRRGEDRELYLQACDPGEDADVDIGNRSMETMAYPVTRLYLWAGLADQGYDLDEDADVYSCYADTFLRSATMDELNDPDVSDDRIQELFEDTDRACT